MFPFTTSKRAIDNDIPIIIIMSSYHYSSWSRTGNDVYHSAIEPREWKYCPGGQETRRGFYYPFKPSEEYPPKQFIYDIYFQGSTYLDRENRILNLEIHFLYDWGYKLTSDDNQFEETIFNYVYQNLEVFKIE